MRPRDLTRPDFYKFGTNTTTDSGWMFSILVTLDISIRLNVPGKGMAMLNIPRKIWDETVEWFAGVLAKDIWNRAFDGEVKDTLCLGKKFSSGHYEWRFDSSRIALIVEPAHEYPDGVARDHAVSIYCHHAAGIAAFYLLTAADFMTFVDWYNSEYETSEKAA